MKRTELEHIIRAAGDLLGERSVIIVGSQAILATHSEIELPVQATRSLEADVLPIDDPDGAKADQIDGALGEGSHFDQSFGIHADGVSVDTAVVPSGWRERLIPYANENTSGVTGLCLEPHDLCVSKLMAFREKDRDFVRALLSAGLVDPDVIIARLNATATEEVRLDQARAFVQASRMPQS